MEDANLDYDQHTTPPPPEYPTTIRKMDNSTCVMTPHDDIADKYPNMDKSAKWVPPASANLLEAVWSHTYIPAEPSNFEDRVCTNYIPSQPEIYEIKHYISKVSSEVSAYEGHIAKLEAQLSELRSRQGALKDVVRAHERLISPLRRLPPEILQVIFVWCLPTTRNAVMHASEAPVLLGRVCSEWRKISLGTPELWASLHIVPPNFNTIPGPSTPRFERKRDLISMWLARSGACPLSISFVWLAGESEEEIMLCGLLLDVLKPMCNRWKVLDFQAPLKVFRPFIGITVEDVPLLEGISLMDNRTPLEVDAVDRWPESLTFAESAKKLRNFTLTFFSGGIRLPTIPWSQLTLLYLESNIAFFFCDTREMLDTLASCVSLQNCTLKFPLSHTASLPPYEALNAPVTLPHLHTLCIDGDQYLQNTFHMSSTLANLCVPRLRKLEILGRSGRPAEGSPALKPLVAIKTLLQRSKCPLERLNVESMTLVPEEFIACLRLVPSLTELVVHNWSVRIMTGLYAGEVNGGHADDTAEDQILNALTAFPQQLRVNDRAAYYTQQLNDIGQALNEIREWIDEVDPDGAQDTSLCGSSFSSEINPAGIIEDTVANPALAEQDNRTVSQDTLSLPPDTCDTLLIPPSSSSLSAPPPNPENELICPNLQRFDFTLCDASQTLLCDFVASRWTDPLPGIARLKSVKCNFTAFEDLRVKERLQKFRAEGLDAQASYQVPVNDDANPSPWTGLDGPGP